MTSKYEILAQIQLNKRAFPAFVREYRFHPDRRWRADFAFPEYRVIVEIHGGIWTSGRHTRGSGFAKDREKSNAAQLQGWIVLEFTPAEIKNETWIQTLRQALFLRGWSGV